MEAVFDGSGPVQTKTTLPFSRFHPGTCTYDIPSIQSIISDTVTHHTGESDADERLNLESRAV